MPTNDWNNRILTRFSKLLPELQQYIVKLHATDYAYVNTRLLAKAVIDYFEDIEKLKLFEGMTRANEAKVYAYEAFWLLRRKPVQIVVQKLPSEVGLYINEFIVSAMLISRMYEEAGIKKSGTDQERMRFFALLFYNFKYRQYDQKSLEVMIEAFLLGHKAS